MNVKMAKRLALIALGLVFSACVMSGAESGTLPYPIPLSDYPKNPSLWGTLCDRVEAAPFNLFATIVFLLAIVHTFSHGVFTKLSEKYKQRTRMKVSALESGGKFYSEAQKPPVCFRAEIFHLLGEMEAIFALWLIPLFAGFWAVYGWADFTAYLNEFTFDQKKYVEPVFVVVVMFIAGTRPIIQLAGDTINVFARLFRGRVWAWWFAIMAMGPLLGSFITEPAAITICATLLVRHFYTFGPSLSFRYATIGLLFASVSAGGTLTHFAAPPVLMVAHEWGWGMPFMFMNFGWKAALAILVASFVYLLAFRKEFPIMQRRYGTSKGKGASEPRVPFGVVSFHVGFFIFTLPALHYPALFMFAFLLFLAFVGATSHFQYAAKMKNPILVGLFLAALVTHGSLQGWWIEPVLESFGHTELFFGAIFLTAFNDNAAITYLASLVPDFSDQMKYMVVAGAVAGGGLTVIANAPNPAGVAILRQYFRDGLSPLKLLAAALLPTAIISAAFYFL